MAKAARERKRAQFKLGLVDPTHGLSNTYKDYGCRCEPCTVANREACRANTRSRVERLASANVTHGLLSTYTGWRCRCKPCVLAAKASRREQRYALSAEAFDALMTEQDGQCAICSTPLTGDPCVDHDHVTGVVRGLLCRLCNLGIGHFEDDVDRLRRAITYLERS